MAEYIRTRVFEVAAWVGNERRSQEEVESQESNLRHYNDGNAETADVSLQSVRAATDEGAASDRIRPSSLSVLPLHSLCSQCVSQPNAVKKHLERPAGPGREQCARLSLLQKPKKSLVSPPPPSLAIWTCGGHRRWLRFLGRI